MEASGDYMACAYGSRMTARSFAAGIGSLDPDGNGGSARPRMTAVATVVESPSEEEFDATSFRRGFKFIIDVYMKDYECRRM